MYVSWCECHQESYWPGSKYKDVQKSLKLLYKHTLGLLEGLFAFPPFLHNKGGSATFLEGEGKVTDFDSTDENELFPEKDNCR